MGDSKALPDRPHGENLASPHQIPCTVSASEFSGGSFCEGFRPLGQHACVHACSSSPGASIRRLPYWAFAEERYLACIQYLPFPALPPYLSLCPNSFKRHEFYWGEGNSWIVRQFCLSMLACHLTLTWCHKVEKNITLGFWCHLLLPLTCTATIKEWRLDCYFSLVHSPIGTTFTPRRQLQLILSFISLEDVHYRIHIIHIGYTLYIYTHIQ